MEFAMNFGLGILGIVFYNVMAFRDFLNTKDLGTRVFWNSYLDSSKYVWAWSLLVIVLVDAIVVFFPEVAGALTTISGWEISTNPASFLTLAFAVSAVKDNKKK